VGIGRFRRKSEENFVGRSEVIKVGNFTDFTDQPFIPTPTCRFGFGRLSRFGLGPKTCIGPIGWAEILYWTYSFLIVGQSRPKSAEVGQSRPNSLIFYMSKRRRFDSRPKSVMSGQCRSKTDFSQIPTAYRTDIVGNEKSLPPTVRRVVSHSRHTAGMRQAVKMPTPVTNYSDKLYFIN
jgi:hypothetical protein